jgi:hypothetical protein
MRKVELIYRQFYVLRFDFSGQCFIAVVSTGAPAMKSTLLPLAAAAALFLGFSAPAAVADDYVSLGKAGGWNIIANSIGCGSNRVSGWWVAEPSRGC